MFLTIRKAARTLDVPERLIRSMVIWTIPVNRDWQKS